MTGASPDHAPRYRALGHDFSVHADDAQVAELLGDILTDLRAGSGPAPHRYELRGPPDDDSTGWTVRFDGRRIGGSGAAWTAVARLLWCVNRGVLRDTDADVLLHAGAVDIAGAGVIVAGAAGSGKSTLVAALVRAGAAYVTDETVALERSADEVLGFPRALSLDPGSWPLLPELAPHVVTSPRRLQPHQWQLPVSRLPGARIATRTTPRVVVLPAYRPGASPPRVLSPADAVIALSACVFPTASPRAAVLRRLARLAERVRCVELVHDDLDVAVRDIVDLAGQPVPPTAPPTVASNDAPAAPSTHPGLRRRDGATLIRAGDEGLIDDARTGELHRVNATGADLWDLLDQPRCAEELTGALAAAYARAPTDVADEVTAYLGALAAAGLVEPAG